MNGEEPQGSSKWSRVHIRTTMGITATKSRDKNSSQCGILVSQETSDFLRNSKKFICVLCCILWSALSRLAGRHGAGQMPHREDKPGCLQLLNLEGSAGQAGVPGLICVRVKWVPLLTFQATLFSGSCSTCPILRRCSSWRFSHKPGVFSSPLCLVLPWLAVFLISQDRSHFQLV